MKHALLILLISSFQICTLYSQTPPYYHYTSTDGLASATVFHMFQDKEGFIWFGTMNGLSKFDGKRFTTFSINDGLNSNSITAILEGDRGELYFANFEKGINILRNERIENYLDEINGKAFSTAQLIKHDNKIYGSYGYYGITVFTDNLSPVTSAYVINPLLNSVNKLAKLPDGKLAALTINGIFQIDNDSLIKINIQGLPASDVLCLANGINGNYFIGTKGFIYQIKNNSVVKKINIGNIHETDVNHIFIDSKNNIWFAIKGKGSFLIPFDSDKIINLGIKLGLGKAEVNGYMEDNEGNIWVSTFGKGVYCLNNLYLRNYVEADGLNNNNVHSIIKEKSGKIIIGTFRGINIFEDGKIFQLKNSDSKVFNADVFGIKYFDDSIYVSWSYLPPVTKYINDRGLNFILMTTRSFLKTSDGEFLFGSWSNNIIIKNSVRSTNINSFFIFGDSMKNIRIYDIAEDSRKNIWAATGQGLCRLTRSSDSNGNVTWKKSFFKEDKILNSRINFIHKDNSNNIWFAGTNGIASYNIDTDSIKSYLSIDGYDLYSANSIVSDNKNRVWIGTMRGLHLWDGEKIKHLNSKNGFKTNEVLCLFFDKETNILYVGTSNGFSQVDVEAYDSYEHPALPVKIIGLKAGDSVYTNYNNLEFEPEQNNVYLDFKAVNFSSPGTVKYKYKLNDKWTETEDDFLNLVALRHGSYEIQLMAKIKNSDWGKPSILSFIIKPQYDETWWFYSGIILFFVFTVFTVVMQWMKQKTKKISGQLELTEKINNLKHQALSAMMNPHFIFNALNSVQYLVNNQKNEEANDYIAMMARLIRKNLDTAGNAFILLDEEIERLKLYLEIEKLRFFEKFSYDIIADPDINTHNTMIPNMIIQPFVENTLWHGIINSGSKGTVTVSFSFAGADFTSALSSDIKSEPAMQMLMIKISDNGIGIIKAKENKKETHTSRGIEIIEERLKLLSAELKLPSPIMIEDLSSRNRSSHGTEVIISLPPALYRNISTSND